MTHATSGLTLGLRTVPSTPRPTPPSGGARFHEALAATSSTLVATVESVASLVPGARVVATAVRGALSEASPSASVGLPRSDAQLPASSGGILATAADDAMGLLALQQQIGLEQQRFQTASNVLKARHDTAKAVISNVR